jgi:hypothetical protein
LNHTKTEGEAADRMSAVNRHCEKYAAACAAHDARGRQRARTYLDQLILSGTYLAHVDFRHLNQPVAVPELVGVTGIVEHHGALTVAVHDADRRCTYVSALTFVTAVGAPGGYGGPAFELRDRLSREMVERRFPHEAGTGVRYGGAVAS